MPIVVTNIASGTAGVGATSFVTPSVTLPANALIIFSVGINDPGTAGAAVTSITGAAGFTFVNVNVFNSSNGTSVEIWRALNTSPATGALTVNLNSGTPNDGYYSIESVTGVVLSGTSGSGAIRQNTGSSSNAGGFSSATLTLAAIQAGNAVYGYLASATTPVTPGSGYSQLSLASVGANFAQAQTRITNITTTCDWSWTAVGGSNFAAIAIELIAASTPNGKRQQYSPDQYDKDGYVFVGGLAPFKPRQLNPTVMDVAVNNPPFRHQQRTLAQMAIPVQAAQPDPWVYAYAGGRQPYAPRRAAPDLIDVHVDNPPFSQRRLGAVPIMYAWAPDPWPYVFEGRSQPYEPRHLNPTIILVPAENPPFGIPNVNTSRAILDQWKPEDWPYTFMGGESPYQQRHHLAGTSGWSVDPPPFTHRGRTVEQMSVVSQQQPDPWTYNFSGGWGPFIPRKLAPGTPGSSVDAPPFRHPSRTPQVNVPVAQWQPEVWPYAFMGSLQPYVGRHLPPVITAVPIQINYRLTVRNVIVRFGPIVGSGWPGNTYPPKNEP